MAHEVMRAVSESVLGALEEGLADAQPSPSIRAGDLRPEAADGPVVNVFFHSLLLNENGAPSLPTRAMRPQRSADDEGYVFHPPPVALTLSFMVTVHGAGAADELELLGRVIQTFQESPRLAAPPQWGALGPFAVSPDARLTPERLTALFSTHGAPARLAVGYLTRIELRSEKVLREAPATRVLKQRLRRQGQAPASHVQPDAFNEPNGES